MEEDKLKDTFAGGDQEKIENIATGGTNIPEPVASMVEGGSARNAAEKVNDIHREPEPTSTDVYDSSSAPLQSRCRGLLFSAETPPPLAKMPYGALRGTRNDQ